MSVISKPWKLYNTIKNIVKDSKPTGKVIKKVKPNVPATRLEKASRDLKLAKQKTKGSEARLKQTQFEIDQANKGKGDYNFTFDPLKANVKKKSKLRENKMGGGMMGRRFGMKEGKLAVTPREKKLAAQYGDKKRITRGDVITIAKKKGNKNGKTMS
jgi:hypothetical protein